MISRLASSAIFASAMLLSSMDIWAQRPELVVQTGPATALSSMAFSPDGKTLAMAGGDRMLKLWDVASGRELRALKGHPHGINSVAFSPDGKMLASGSYQTIKLWSVVTGSELRKLGGPSADGETLAFSPDGTTLASGSWAGNQPIRLWDVASGNELRTLKGHSGSVKALAFNSDGTTLASGSGDRTIKLWDVASGSEIRTLKGHSGVVTSVAFSPDGKTLASADNDYTIKLWDVASGNDSRTLKGGPSVGFSPDGKTLAGGDGITIKLWDVASANELRALRGHSGSVSSLAFSPDGTTLASLSGVTIKLWDVARGSELRTLKRHSSPIYSVAFSPDGKTFASGGVDDTIKLWDVASGRELRALKGHSDSVMALAFSPDGKTLASGSLDQRINVWDVVSGQLRRSFRHYGPITSVNFSLDGKLLASGSSPEYTETGAIKDSMIRIWDLASGSEFRALPGHSYAVLSVAFSPDGKTLASGGDDVNDRAIKLWDVAAGRELRTLKGLSGGVRSVAFGPDGKTLAGGDGDHTIKLWDVVSGSELRALKGHTSGVNDVAFSPDGKTLVSCSADNTIKLWEVASGSELRTFGGHSDQVTSVAFSPDASKLVSGSWDASLKVWDAGSGKELATLIALDERDWVAITPDGMFDGSAEAWKKILWRFNSNTFDYAPVEAFFNEFYYPGLITDAFAGKVPNASSDITQKDRRQPLLEITERDGKVVGKLAERNVTVKIHVSAIPADQDQKTGSGAQDVRLFRNGSLVKVWRGDVLKGQTSVTLEAAVPIVAGENKFTAYAFNHDNVKSSDAELIVTGAERLKRQGTAYIVAIGIDNYSNPDYRLNFAGADAKDFAAEVKRQQESLKRYARIEVIPLADAQATKANITQKLRELAKQVQPEDAVVVFFAGHGTAQGNQFYLIPHDLGYQGPRQKLTKAGLQTVVQHSISDRELERLFEGIDAGQLLLVIDACNSGQALEAEEKRRGPMNSKGLAQLAYEKGMYVMTAAQSYQAAMEASKFGHGFLTYALVEEGLKKGSADREPKNGAIDIREWLNFATDEVPRMQEHNSREALRGRGRYVVFVGDGRAVGIRKTQADARDNIQRPRVFYRRELEANPLIVAAVGAGAPQ